MSAAHKEDGVVSKEEANICLTCEKNICKGNCDRLRKEKRRLKTERKTQDISKPREEFVIPDEAPWGKKKKKHKIKKE